MCGAWYRQCIAATKMQSTPTLKRLNEHYKTDGETQEEEQEEEGKEEEEQEEQEEGQLV